MLLDSMVEVPEHIVASAAASIPDDPYNSFIVILESGRLYKEAGMTPIYILDRQTMNLHVVAEETFGKKLN